MLFELSVWPVANLDSYDWYAQATDEAIEHQVSNYLIDAVEVWKILTRLAHKAEDYRAARHAAYCAANAQGALAELEADQETRRSLREQQKASLLRALLIPVDNPQLESALRCNCANMLSEQGRIAEAIYHWEEALHHDKMNFAARFCLAQGNERLGSQWPKEGWHFAEEAFLHYRFVALTDPPETVYFDPRLVLRAREELQTLIEKIESCGVPMETFHSHMEQRFEAHPDFEPSREVKLFAAERLLLTIEARPLLCPIEARDKLLVTGLGKRSTFSAIQIADYLNAVTEEYIFARSLALETFDNSEIEKQALEDSLTDYISIPGVSLAGKRSVLPKTALRITLDAFDKLAKILVDCLSIQDDNKGRPWAFNNIWYERKDPKNPVRPSLLSELEKPSPTHALYDIARSLRSSESPYKVMRDAATHDRLHISEDGKWFVIADQEADIKLYWVTDVLFEVLRIIRQAIISTCQIINGLAAQEGTESQAMFDRVPG